jgi:hypothetical protein
MITHLTHHFSITTGPAEVYVGMRITRDRPNRQLWIDQSRFILNMLEKYGFSHSHPVATPGDPSDRLRAVPRDDSSPIPDFPYASAVGSLMYVAVISRPDIAAATTTVAQYTSNLREPHVTAVRRIMKYLRGSTNYALSYSATHDTNILSAYSDADYGGDLDDRKSRTGCVMLLNDGPIIWCTENRNA